MSKGKGWIRPSDAELEKLLAKHGCQQAVGDIVGVPRGTLSNWYTDAQRKAGRKFSGPAPNI